VQVYLRGGAQQLEVATACCPRSLGSRLHQQAPNAKAPLLGTDQ
jgi:hypothetical protein